MPKMFMQSIIRQKLVVEMGKNEEALSVIEKAVIENPNDDTMQSDYGLSYLLTWEKTMKPYFITRKH